MREGEGEGEGEGAGAGARELMVGWGGVPVGRGFWENGWVLGMWRCVCWGGGEGEGYGRMGCGGVLVKGQITSTMISNSPQPCSVSS
jgi:hypothetical protein